MQCPLCGTRKPRRFCPAKSAQICSICCATKREVEIDCPVSCGYLREGYNYAEVKNPLEQRARTLSFERTFDRTFLIANEALLMELWQVIWEAFQSIRSLHDSDVISALAALEKTYRTLDSGLYYDSRPENSLQQLLYSKLKEHLDIKMQNPDVQQHHLKVSTVVDCLNFMQQFAQMKSSGRPLSRGFLLQLEEIFARMPGKSTSAEPRILLS